MLPASFTRLMACRRILMLQGPMGPFFRQLAGYLADAGARVVKVNFNGGDEFFFRRGAVAYRGEQGGFGGWLQDLAARERADAIVLFGQARPLHRIAIDEARCAGIPVFVFEEGYLRPDFVTLEVGGVNGRSEMPREPAHYTSVPYIRPAKPRPTRQSFARVALTATAYGVASAALSWRFAHYAHHRSLNPLVDSLCWVRGGLRKLRYAQRDKAVMPQLCAPERSKRWFLLPLQVHNDAQIIEHSPFTDMPQVMRAVLASFAASAPADAELVIKHHPMDRAYRDYGATVRTLVREFGLHGRVHYVHDLHLPTLLKHARGIVTVNSTTGLQALYHGTPVCVLGDCFYDIPRLTHQGGMDSFWREPQPVDRELYWRFRAWLVHTTQLNASFYADAPSLARQRSEPRPSAFEHTMPHYLPDPVAAMPAPRGDQG